MIFLRRNKKEQNPTGLKELDYSVLSYEQLLEVNGAGGGSSGGGGGPSGPTGGSGSNLTDQGYPSSTDYNPGIPPSNGPYTGSNLTDQGYPSSTDPNPGTPPSSGPYTSGSGSCGGECSSSSGGCSGGSQTPTERVEAAIKRIGKKDYIIGSYQCDEYVADVLSKAGYNPKDYYVDNPHGKDVDTHISELTKSGKSCATDASKLQAGTYVVFMQDADGAKDSHAALLVVESGSSAYIMDNSSHNNPIYGTDSNGKTVITGYNGGTEKTSGGNASTICSWYTGYENFYFQKIGG